MTCDDAIRRSADLAAISFAPTAKLRSCLFRFGLPLTACALLLGYAPLYIYRTYHLLPYEDDAFYYFTIVRNIHDFGRSTFDGQTLTNGYHPLWLVVLLIQYFICKSFDITILIELALLLCGLAFLIAALKSRRPIDYALLTLAYSAAISGFTLNGMETSLLIFCLSALIWALERFDLTRDEGAVRAGLIAAAAIGARIDAGVFVVPLVLLALPTPRSKTIAIGIIAGFGLAYLAFNEIVFGAVMPFSASIKSLGGFQLNGHLLHDFRHEVFHPGFGEEMKSMFDSAVGNSDYYRILVVCVAAAGLALFAPPRGFARHLLFAFLIGMTLYAVKLLLFSSWVIWPWYFYPEFIGTYACLRAVPQAFENLGIEPLRKPIKIGFLLLLIGIVVWPAEDFATDPPEYDWLGFSVINQRAIDTFGPTFAGARVAMGDRAGSFAFHYRGSTVQLEGLVEDKSYFDMLADHGNLKTVLCRRGVKFILAYATDLGAYKTYRIHALRPWLTGFHGPSVAVRKEDEVGRVFDLDVFDSLELGDDGDSYLYAWRLSRCPQTRDTHTR